MNAKIKKNILLIIVVVGILLRLEHFFENRSLWLDAKILMMTLLKVIKREGVSQEGHATMEPFRGTRE